MLVFCYEKMLFFKTLNLSFNIISFSHCPQHNWKSRAQKFKPSKKSVFAAKDEKRAAAARPVSQDQSAGDTDDELLAPPGKLQVSGYRTYSWG